MGPCIECVHGSHVGGAKQKIYLHKKNKLFFLVKTNSIVFSSSMAAVNTLYSAGKTVSTANSVTNYKLQSTFFSLQSVSALQQNKH